ncbi:hypothetical protein PQX77_017230 [Marasmius sp. AFHP31]|nr:hypothetical protein PQX77_017230 [Marasmius sp. AFHP31]
MDSSTDPYSIRITSGGKIKSWVSFSLEYLEKDENANRPLVFHTLPATSETTGKDAPAPSKTACNASNVINTIPRLISVVEIIKREYVKLLETKHSTRLIGLHQYNQTGTLEDLGLAEDDFGVNDEEQRTLELSRALDGKNFPKQKQTPYMKITLCCIELPDLVTKGATYQPPSRRRISKSARARAKKRQKKSERETNTAGEDHEGGE